MAKVQFCNENITVEVDEGVTILEAARWAGITIESPCNGTGTCCKCKVKIDGKSVNNILHGNNYRFSREEYHGVTRESDDEWHVLACETRIKGDIIVKTFENHKNRCLKILEHGKSLDIAMDTYIRKEYDARRNLTHVYAGEEFLGSENGDTTFESFGAVVDIGTTTLVASLANLNSGEELDSVSALNPQAVHAQDVLSRIKLASEKSGLKLMYSELIAEINRMIVHLARKNNISNERIYEVVFSGNTCMLHLATNTNPYSLGRFPYNPEIIGDIHLKSSEHNLVISKFGLIYLPPIISAYVGADITSGILASQLHERKGITLFVDIGTNGEMVLACDGSLSATSTAAGPAFEGMNITHGMRAGTGAVEFFNIEDRGNITIKTIGNEEAVGICGSGLLDIVGELVAFGVINKNGKLINPEKELILPALRERIMEQDGKLVFKVADQILLTQKDIRQVQLAKGAIRTGIEFLLKSKGIKASEVDKVLIAGSFGYHLRAKSLMNIGLLPREFEGKIEFIGNTSKSGGQAFLLNKNYRKQMAELVKDIEVIELANYKDFDKVFVSYLNF